MMRRAILFNDTRIDRHHGCSSVIESIIRLCARHEIELIHKLPAHSPWQDDPDLPGLMARADLVIVNGEGSIHHDRPAGKRLLQVAQYARAQGCASALINTTWARNSADLARLAAGFDLVSLRESASRDELAAHGIACRVIPDLALYTKPPAPRPRHGILVTDNVVAGQSLALHHRLNTQGARPLSLLWGRRDPLNVLRNLRRYRLDPKARKMGWGTALSAALDDWRAQTKDRDAFLRQLVGAELVVTGRFHALILCLATDTPVIALPSNTHKNRATLHDAGLAPWRAPEDVEQIDTALLQRARNWQEQEAPALANWRAGGCAAMEQLFADLARLAPR